MRTKSKKKKRPPTRKKKEDVMSQVIRLTGIPARSIRNELGTILKRKGLNPKKLTLDQLRGVVATYLREIMGSLLESSSRRPEQSN